MQNIRSLTDEIMASAFGNLGEELDAHDAREKERERECGRISGLTGEALELAREVQRRRERELSYQTELADTLTAIDGRWVEIASDGYDEIDAEMEVCGGDMLFDSAPPTLHQFYQDLYGISSPGADAEILVNYNDRRHVWASYDDYSEFISAVKRETAYICPGTFYRLRKGYLTGRLSVMKTLGALVVDIDRSEGPDGKYFEARGVIETLLETFGKHPAVRPNYLCLSGTGLHLWYVFGDEVPLYRATDKILRDGAVKRASPRRRKYGAVSAALYRWFADTLPRNLYKVDETCVNINHAYRAPASPTKHGFPTRMFVYGGKDREYADPVALSDFLGCRLKPYDVGAWNPERYERYKADHPEEFGEGTATEKQLETLRDLAEQGYLDEDEITPGIVVRDADKLIRKGLTMRSLGRQTGRRRHKIDGEEIAEKPRHAGLYEYTLDRIRTDTPVGTREKALFALAGLGYNCLVGEDKVRDDMEGLLATEWARRRSTDGKPLGREDIEAAIKGYNPKGACMSRDKREDCLGWKYGPPAKRNGRKQADHLVFARTVKKVLSGINESAKGGRPTKQSQVHEWKEAHPGGSKSQCARDTGVSRTTVTKWWNTAAPGEAPSREEGR